MSKVLIHFPIDKLVPKGGPAGYLLNLRQGLIECGFSGSFDFLPEAGASIESNALLRNFVPKRLKDIRRLHNFMNLPNRSLASPVDYSRYDAVHFHSTEDLYLHRKALADYCGKVVLTSHSPCVYHKELISRLNPSDANHHCERLKSLEVVDEFSFRRADAVIFPCPDAEEPYFHTWAKYGEVRDPSKLSYVPTGIQPCHADTSRTDVRKLYGIPEDAFLITYIGRHNEIKGYGDLLHAAPRLFDDEKVWFLIAGREEPLRGLGHPRWIEVGWTDDPHSIISAADLFILPNRETYYDLIMLETLSLGQLILASNTGGNRSFEKYGSEGIVLYDGEDELVMSVDRVKSLSNDQTERARRANKALYESEFSCRKFAERYVACMKEICGE
ncbi:glycosyltransferase family 4 protein [Parolsenella catena]|uniref:glycosyltransferase family 4 protein n=1 Tax=Parolsenella catena TaxID=2003188 RepID=UPI003F9C6567